ncbi:hypothetical protein CEQ90_11700 [Lewinellaceae bacterium SD302]|nr:hypothetical protein CEQ90_11700 [Lewinellaceae bacterium SD302]
MLYFLIVTVVLFALATALVLNLHPVFGATSSGDSRTRISQSPNQAKGRFHYLEPTKVSTGFDPTKFSAFFRKGDTIPDRPLPTREVKPDHYDRLPAEELRITWFGHSTLLFEIGGKRILSDPIFSAVPSPFSFLGQPRFENTHNYSVEDLPEIDLIILSHDHYDHLDYPSIRKLKDRVQDFVVPLGVGAHLERWGIAANRITELDWWEQTDYAGIQLTCTPARHFSGRGLFNRYSTLWCAWAIRFGDYHNIFHGADSGYGIHFRQVGEKLGPFDFALLECGQYNDMWHQIHAMPEELLQAWDELNVRTIMPIHWGAFKLAMHSWTEPPERLLAAAGRREERILTPYIGKRFSPYEVEENRERWWRFG